MSKEILEMEEAAQRRQALAVAPQPRAVLAQTQDYTISELERVAMAMARSGFFEDSRDAAQAFVKILAGKEYGLGPLAAMTGIFIVKSRPTLSATTIAGLIKRSGRYTYEATYLTRADGKLGPVKNPLNDVVAGCAIQFYENGIPLEPESYFTDSDAVRAGLSSGDNWKKYPKAMYFSRALTQGARMHTPELFGGAIYTPDEVSDKILVDSSGAPTNLEVAQPALEVRADPMPEAPRVKPMPLKDLQERFAAIVGFLPEVDGKPQTLGMWLDATIVPGLATRKDPITGRRIGLTDEENVKAQDALATLILERAPDRAAEFGYRLGRAPYDTPVVEETVAEPDPPTFDLEEPSPQESAQMAFVETTGLTPGVPYAPHGTAQHKALMARFSARKGRLEDKYREIGLTTQEARRHQFAIDVLGDPAKGSSKTWNEIDFRRVMNALEMIPGDEPGLL
jgi:hypothetical protein